MSHKFFITLVLCLLFLAIDFYQMYIDSYQAMLVVILMKIAIFTIICVISQKPFLFLLPIYLLIQLQIFLKLYVSDFDQILKITSFVQKFQQNYGQIIDLYKKYQTYDPTSLNFKYLSDKYSKIQTFLESNWNNIVELWNYNFNFFSNSDQIIKSVNSLSESVKNTSIHIKNIQQQQLSFGSFNEMLKLMTEIMDMYAQGDVLNKIYSEYMNNMKYGDKNIDVIKEYQHIKSVINDQFLPFYYQKLEQNKRFYSENKNALTQQFNDVKQQIDEISDLIDEINDLLLDAKKIGIKLVADLVLFLIGTAIVLVFKH